MKKTRKIIAVALTVLMLMSAVAINSFAAFDFLKAPEVVSVAFIGRQSISLKDIKSYYDKVEEFKEEYGSMNMGDEFYDYLYNYDLGYSSVDYFIEVTMNDGTKADISIYNSYVDISKVYTVEVEAYVSHDDYLKAVESGADTVDVVIETYVYNNLFETYTADEPKVFTTEMNLADCFVKSISEVSGVPSEICKSCDYYELDGAVFSVEYADGRKENYTVEVLFGKIHPTYMLNREKIYVYDEEGKLCVEYLDEVFEKDITYVEEPFKSIKITDCDYDTENLILKSLSYTIEWKNGNTKAYTYAPSSEGITLMSETIERVDGFNVSLDALPFAIDYKTGEIDYDKINITVFVGEELSDTYEIDSPYAKPLNTITSVAEFFSKIVSFFRNIISFVADMLFAV